MMHVAALAIGEARSVIEQTADTQLARQLEELSAQTRSGAVHVAEIAADILQRRSLSGEAASPDAFRHELLTTGWGIIRAQPTMAPLVNLVNHVLWRTEEQETPRALRQAVLQSIDDFKRQLRRHAHHVAESALTLINDGARIVTLSNSTSVQHALLHAQRAGRRFSVICAESRPLLEGRQTAELLASRGIDVQLVVDMAAIAAVAHAQLVLVGADMLSTRGLINKMGTYPLALAAARAGVPLYTLCGSEKFLPPGFRALAQRNWPATEVWDGAPGDLKIANQYSDVTPLSLVSGIVTERGVLPVAAIEAWLATTRLHYALAEPQRVGIAGTG